MLISITAFTLIEPNSQLTNVVFMENQPPAVRSFQSLFVSCRSIDDSIFVHFVAKNLSLPLEAATALFLYLLMPTGLMFVFLLKFNVN